jgi:Mor family transcriptional regulator
MNSLGTGKTRIRVEELLVLFGEQVTKRLIFHGGGRRIPSAEQYQRVLRRLAVVHDWLNRGYSQPDLALKYGLSLSYVRRIITRHLNQRFRNRVQDAD